MTSSPAPHGRDALLQGTFFIVMWVIAGTKPGGGRGATALSEGTADTRLGRVALLRDRDTELRAAADAQERVLPALADVPVAPQTTAWTDSQAVAWTEERRFDEYDSVGRRARRFLPQSLLDEVL